MVANVGGGVVHKLSPFEHHHQTAWPALEDHRSLRQRHKSDEVCPTLRRPRKHRADAGLEMSDC